MANEAEIISNPTSVPSAVSESYARQNTRAYAATNGMDSTYMAVTGATSVALYPSGPVDVNGTLYAVKSQVNFTVNTVGAHYIHLVGTGDKLTPTLSTDAGTWSAAKNARYNSNGERVLNWVIGYGGVNGSYKLYIEPLHEPELGRNSIAGADQPEKWLITANNTWTAPRSKYYTIEIQAMGGGGGYASSGGKACGGSGGGGGYMRHRIYIPAGEVWTAVFTTIGGANITFSNGVTVMTAQNGYRGKNVSGQFVVAGESGAGGGFWSGADFGVNGGRGTAGTRDGTLGDGVVEYDPDTSSYTEYVTFQYKGGDSYMGKGADTRYFYASNIHAARRGNDYGGGATGTWVDGSTSAHMTAAGGAAIIIITG